MREIIKDLVRTHRNNGKGFVEKVTITQGRTLTVINGICLVYAILACCFFGKAFLASAEHIRTEYGYLLFVVSLSLSLSVMWSTEKPLWKGRDQRYKYIMAISVLTVLLYISWGHLCMVMSIMEGRTPNYLPLLMIYAISCTFLFFYPIWYPVFLVLGAAGVHIILHHLYGKVNLSVLLNVTFFLAILSLAGVTKYINALIIYKQKLKETRLRNELEVSNKEYVSVNEKLTKQVEIVTSQNEKQRLFTASMNHELRSPLNGIIGLLKLNVGNTSLSDNERKQNDLYALQAADALCQIVNDLLDYARLEHGNVSIANEPFDLREIVDGVIAFSQVGANKGCSVLCDVKSNTPRMYTGDGARIRQIITNIMSNAVKYTDSGTISLILSYSDSTLWIDISDTGQGMSDNELVHALEPFVRLNEKQHSQIKGTGLGLSIVNGLIKQMEGSIHITSAVNVGTTVSIMIPVTCIDDGIGWDDTIIVSNLDNYLFPQYEGLRVLCVDDSRVSLRVLKGLLEPSGINVDLATDGIEAVNMCRKTRYDLIFLDHMMPRMDGIETFMEIKRGVTNHETPICCLTGAASDNIDDTYKDYGFIGAIVKPVKKDDIYQKIREVRDAKN